MQARSLRIGKLCAMVIAVVAGSTWAHDDITWVHPCPCGDRDEATNDYWNCGFGGFNCRCEGDWDDPDTWDVEDPCVPPMDCGAPPHDRFIVHSTHGCCATGDCDCSQGSDCSTNGCSDSCGDDETKLVISLGTETIAALEITTASTTATTDELMVWFESIDGGGNTVTAGTVTLDATNGDITLIISDSAAIKTDTTD